MRNIWILWVILWCCPLLGVSASGCDISGKADIGIRVNKTRVKKAMEANVFAEIKGQVHREKMREVGLYEVVDGNEVLISTTRIGKNGWYGFAIEPTRAGFYTVGGEKINERIRVYLEAGDRAEVNILEDTLIITNRNTPENLLLARWESIFEPIRRRVDHKDFIFFTYKELFPYYMDFLPRAEAFKNEIRSKNSFFNELLMETVDYDVEYFALKILSAIKVDRAKMKGSRPEVQDCPAYYSTLVSKDKLKDTSLLRQPYGVDYLLRFTNFALQKNKQKYTIAGQLEWVPCDLLKAEIVLAHAQNAKTYEKYDEIVTCFSSYLTTTRHRQRMNDLSAKLYVGNKGAKAADFTYPDRNGKLVSLSDFKGKVVVVDVWATWCGPCRKEIPYLVKLEKEMEGKDVVFIGVSVDEKKDHGVWLETLDKEGLGGIQLFASGWSQIVKDYKIKGIPRFMVFDRQGNVVTIDSPRPSDPRLKMLLEMELKK